MNYTVSKIAGLLGCQFLGTDAVVDGCVVIDSRGSGIGFGDLFVALRGGGLRDGHTFVRDAYARGVRAFMVDHTDGFEDLDGAGFVVVLDTLLALQQLAGIHREAYSGTVVAITGSNGKTVIKEHFAQLWDSAEGQLLRSPRSYNSQIGVALSLLMIEGGERVVVVEAGISHPGEMAALRAMIRPTVGVLTNLGDAHSENFGSASEMLAEKLSLFDGLSNDMVVRGDLITGGSIEERNSQIINELYKILDITPLPDTTPTPLSLRLDVQPGLFGTTIINDSYCNDLTSLHAALDHTLRTAGDAPTTVILSDMEQNQADTQSISQALMQYNIERFVGIGAVMYQHQELIKTGLQGAKKCEFFISTKEFLRVLNAADFTGHTILIKGARSFGFEEVSGRFEQRTHTTVLEVSLPTVVENLHSFQKQSKALRTMAMVKADAYGLGAVAVSRALVEAGVDSLAVAYADEGVELRRGGITAPVVVLNSDPGSFSVMLQHDLEPEIYSLEALQLYATEVRKAGASAMPIHLKLDTGMHRLGFMTHEIPAVCTALQSEDAVRVSSIFTHLSSADDPADDTFTHSQIELFYQNSQTIIDCLGYRPTLSITNSHGTRRFPNTVQDTARVGINLYLGACTLSARITQIKELPAGESIGYNRRHITTKPTTIGTIPIGYADGLDRRLGCSAGHVEVCGVMCPIVGNICMDTTMIDLSAVPAGAAKIGTKVTIMGGTANSETVIAEQLQTIPYEVLCRISKRIKRLYSC